MAWDDNLDMTPRYAPTVDLFPTSTGFRMVAVESAIVHPPGCHPKNSPLIAECAALELRAGGASRWYGIVSGHINSELRMVIIGTPSRDEVRMKWPICSTV